MAKGKITRHCSKGKGKGRQSKLASTMDAHVGARIRALRLKLGINQEALAEMIGLTFQQVQKYEKGTNRIGSGRLYEIAEALDVTPAYFYQEFDDNVVPLRGAKKLQRPSRTLLRIGQVASDLPHQRQEIVLVIAKVLQHGDNDNVRGNLIALFDEHERPRARRRA